MTTINLPFAATGTKRPPNSGELADGLPCGPLDDEMFNWVFWWTTGQAANVITKSNWTPDDAELTRMARAIRSLRMNRATATGTANALVVTLDPAPTAYSELQVVWVTPAADNAAAATTINVNGLGAVNITIGGTAPPAKALEAGIPAMLVWNGTGFSLTGAATTGQLINTITYATAGTFSYTPTAGTKSIRVRVQAAGGGGGGAALASGSNFGGAGGGGGGGSTADSFLVSSLTVPVTITVGAAGAGGVGNNFGTAGGSSSFGALLTTTGGAGGAAGAVSNITHTQHGGAGGSGSGGRVFAGQPGIPTININNTNFVSGSGGPSYFGAGGNPVVTNSGDGNAALVPGAGGGGAGARNTFGPFNGGAGGAGIIIIEEYA